MLKIRIEFMNEVERLNLIKALAVNYVIAKEDKVKLSSVPGSKYKLQYLELIPKS
ncbi:MAG: hypothetical protein RR646_04330 [Erysipelotrichaceae bacterium]